MCSPRRVPSVLAALALTGLIAAGGAARASLILALDMPTLVSRADNIAVVDVVSVKADWNPSHQRILTTVDLLVVDSWKGAAAPATHLQVVQPGGTAGDITMTVDGMAPFVAGERALVFLRGRPDRASVVGMAQGKRVVHREPAGARWMVRAPDRAGADFVRPKSQGKTAGGPPPVFEQSDRPLAEVRSEVLALCTTAGGAR
jgi:hypothetical protein